MTDVSLREYVDRLFEEREVRAELREKAHLRALDHASRALEARLESMNEFRAQISQERATYVTRQLLDQGVGARVQAIEQSMNNLIGRLWAVGVGITLGVAVLGLLSKWMGK